MDLKHARVAHIRAWARVAGAAAARGAGHVAARRVASVTDAIGIVSGLAASRRIAIAAERHVSFAEITALRRQETWDQQEQ